MIDNNNILLITDRNDVADLITDRLVLLRNNDRISVCSTLNIKKVLANSLYKIVILHESDDTETTLKNISTIKNIKSDVEIILLLNEINAQLIIEAYDNGIYDYFTLTSDDYEMLIKTVNCFKMQVSKEIQNRNEKFLYQMGVIDSKTNLYKDKYLKDIFLDISNDLRIQNGVFVCLTLDEKIKTKVSSNRLAGAIKASVRGDDIISVGKNGVFNLILPNIELTGTKNLIQKIQEKMGTDFPIHSGLTKIGIQSFETLEKNAKDSLISASQNDLLTVCLGDNIDIQNDWLDDDQVISDKKSFKLFRIAFNNKMTSVITPLFYRYQKEYETKLSNTYVSQYTNNIESVFCLKNNVLMSELVIRYNGYTKFYIEINHSGLDSIDNYSAEIPLAEMDEKLLSSLLKKLKDEHKQSIKIMNDKREINA